MVDHCESEYTYGNEETEDYGTGWKNEKQRRKKRDNYWVVKQNSNDDVTLQYLRSSERRRRNTENQEKPYQSMPMGRSKAYRRRNQMNKE